MNINKINTNKEICGFLRKKKIYFHELRIEHNRDIYRLLIVVRSVLKTNIFPTGNKNQNFVLINFLGGSKKISQLKENENHFK